MISCVIYSSVLSPLVLDFKGEKIDIWKNGKN